MASGMMQAQGTKNSHLDISTLMSLLGKYYQLRDDNNDINLGTGETSSYNDFDQGSFTLPIIHALAHETKKGSTKLLSLIQSRRRNNNGMSVQMKKLIHERLAEAGSLEYTKSALADLYLEMKGELERLEQVTGCKNWILRLMMHRLKI